MLIGNSEWKRLLCRKNIIFLLLVLVADLSCFLFMGSQREYSEEARKNYIDSYSSTVNDVLTRSEKMKLLSLFQEEQGFTASNIDKTSRDYSRVKDLTLVEDEAKVTDVMTSYHPRSWFILAIFVFALYNILQENNNGMWGIIHASKNGRGLFALRRAVVLFISSMLTTFLFTIVEFIAANVAFGFDDYGNPVQTLMEYGQFTQVCSKGMYLIRFTFWNGCVVGVAVLFMYLVFSVVGHRIVSIAVLAVFVFAETMIYRLETLFTNLKMLQYINIYNMLTPEYYDKNYLNVDIFGNAVFLKTVIICVAAGIAVISLVGIFAVGQLKYVRNREIKLLVIMQEAFQKLICRLPVIWTEIAKCLVTSKIVPAFILGIIVTSYVCVSVKVEFPERYKRIDAVYLEYGGSDISRFYSYIDELNEKVESLSEELGAAQESGDDYRYNSIQGDLTVAIKTLAELETKKERIEEYKAKGISLYAMSDRGYDEIIGVNSVRREAIIMLVMIIFAVVASYDVWNIEKASNMRTFLLTYAYGRRHVYLRKQAILLVIVTLAYLTFYGINIVLLASWYDAAYMEAPIQSLSFMNVPVVMSIRAYLILAFLLKYIFAVAAMVVMTLTNRFAYRMLRYNSDTI
jgi:hypothetical protein